MESNSEGLTNIEPFFKKILHEDLKPKPYFLEPWFKYVDKFASGNLPNYKSEIMHNEFAIAHILNQWINFGLDPQKKPVLVTDNLKYHGIDQARLVRYLILQKAYSKKIDLNSKRITFNLDLQTIDNLLKGINQAIPNMNNLSKEQLSKILDNLGFKYNQNSGSYFKAVDQQQFQEMLTKIIYTNSF